MRKLGMFEKLTRTHKIIGLLIAVITLVTIFGNGGMKGLVFLDIRHGMASEISQTIDIMNKRLAESELWQLKRDRADTRTEMNEIRKDNWTGQGRRWKEGTPTWVKDRYQELVDELKTVEDRIEVMEKEGVVE